MQVNDWDAYWRNASSAAPNKDGGARDEALERFWLKFFTQIYPIPHAGNRMLDIGCGNGAVVGFARAAAGSVKNNGLKIYGMDVSPSAVIPVVSASLPTRACCRFQIMCLMW